ncbi:MAG: hypothetical protein M0D55_12935 [Elusimicrobiota bacterium]|nr:MAG: hypothetical protein M0D55_12935 [Elusimicrobiota bacterium]
MNARERAVIDALLPPGGPEGLPGAFEAGFEAFEEGFRRDAPFTMRLGWRAALFVAAWISPLLIRRLPPLDNLAEEEQTEALEALGKSRFYLVRQSSLLLKAVTSFGYGSTPAVRRVVGY